MAGITGLIGLATYKREPEVEPSKKVLHGSYGGCDVRVGMEAPEAPQWYQGAAVIDSSAIEVGGVSAIRNGHGFLAGIIEKLVDHPEFVSSEVRSERGSDGNFYHKLNLVQKPDATFQIISESSTTDENGQTTHKIVAEQLGLTFPKSVMNKSFVVDESKLINAFQGTKPIYRQVPTGHWDAQKPQENTGILAICKTAGETYLAKGSFFLYDPNAFSFTRESYFTTYKELAEVLRQWLPNKVEDVLLDTAKDIMNSFPLSYKMAFRAEPTPTTSSRYVGGWIADKSKLDNPFNGNGVLTGPTYIHLDGNEGSEFAGICMYKDGTARGNHKYYLVNTHHCDSKVQRFTGNGGFSTVEELATLLLSWFKTDDHQAYLDTAKDIIAGLPSPERFGLPASTT